jgi:methylated-DNA-protein-cysteine methyltransferase related protein
VPRERGFFLAVYAAVREVPRGSVATYGQIALRLGLARGARAVGWALRALGRDRKPKVPWHRVVGSGGRISLRDGAGMAEQRRRLLREGVRFSGARVDMQRHGLSLQPVATRGSAKRSRARRFK